MSQTIHLTESKTQLGHDLAKQALLVLTTHYPAYNWYVRVDGGIIDIKCSQIGRASMVRHVKKTDHDAERFRHDIIISAGEFLERAHLRRGVGQGGYARILEGGEKIRWRPIHQ